MTETFSPFFYLFRSADYDRGPGGLWEILPAAGHARRDADHRGESLLEQVRRYSNTSESEELLWFLSGSKPVVIVAVRS